jgi:hypothetical protein
MHRIDDTGPNSAMIVYFDEELLAQKSGTGYRQCRGVKQF